MSDPTVSGPPSPYPQWRCTEQRSHGVCGTCNGADEDSCGACGAPRPTPVRETVSAAPRDAAAAPTLDEMETLCGLLRERQGAYQRAADAVTSAVSIKADLQRRADWFGWLAARLPALLAAQRALQVIAEMVGLDTSEKPSETPGDVVDALDNVIASAKQHGLEKSAARFALSFKREAEERVDAIAAARSRRTEGAEDR